MKEKQAYLCSQTQLMTTKPENILSFYDPQLINCQTFRILSACLSVGKKTKNYVLAWKAIFLWKKKKNQCCYNTCSGCDSCLNFRDSECWWLPSKNICSRDFGFYSGLRFPEWKLLRKCWAIFALSHNYQYSLTLVSWACWALLA